jgi:hypothetical protein
MEFIMGVVKSQLSPFNWKTIVVLVLAVGALFFAFRLFGKANMAPDAVVQQEQQLPQGPPQLSQSEQAYAEQEAQAEQEGQDEGTAAANE